MNPIRSAYNWVEKRFGFGASGGTSGPQSVVGLGPASVLSGVVVTPETALTFTSCFACIQARATDLAALPLQVRKSNGQGGSVLVAGDKRHSIVFSEPNKRTTAIRFFTALHAHRLGWGSGYAEIKRLGGMPVELILHSPRPSDTWPELSESKSLWYAVEGGRRYVRGEDMLHFAGLGYNGVTGYSVIGLHAQAVGYGLALEQYGAAFYGNANTPKGVLKTKKTLNPEALKNLRESFGNVHSGTVNAHRLMILEEDLDFSPFEVIAPNDADYINARKFQAGEMNSIFRVPPPRTMNYDGVGSVYKGFSDVIDDYISSTLGPDSLDVQQEIDRKFFTEYERAQGYGVRHDFGALTRGNAAARAERYTKLFALGSITPNQIREGEGDSPTGDPSGDRYYVATQFTPVCDEPDKPVESNADGEEPKALDPPAPDPALATDLPVQSTALNGAQIDSLLAIATAVTSGSMPPETAKALLSASFPTLTATQIAAIIDPLAGFRPAETDETPPAPPPPPPLALPPPDDDAQAETEE